jgi:paraquat-inducible protein B
MSATDDGERPSARIRGRSWFAWIWLVPLLAAALVATLAIRALAERGPLITISFADAEGLEAGETKIRHKDVDLGTVESIHLSSDMSQVIVQARMRRSVSEHLSSTTRFWIVRPRVSVGGVSGLSTLVSGSYIEMYPALGEAQRQFIGLAEPPIPTPDIPGHAFTLRAENLGSLIAGSLISYRGVPVGEVQGFTLGGAGKGISIHAFVRAPYDKYVNSQSRFWNSGGVEVSVGAQGVRFRAASWQELISGGLSFDTPDSALQEVPSVGGTPFRLYDNEGDAKRDPRGRTLVYRVDLPDGSNDIGLGTSVQLLGVEVGQVTQSSLQYDEAKESLLTRVTLEIDPSRVEITPAAAGSGLDPAAQFAPRLSKLVQRGLRAHLAAANFLTGTKVVALDMVHDAPPAHIDMVDGYARIPSTKAADIAQVLASAQSALAHIDAATAGPQLGHAIVELDRTLSNLDRITAEVEPQIKPLLSSLHDTVEAAQHTMHSADNVLGNGAASGTDLPRLIAELAEAARSLRDLSSYLERHPEALIRGRKADSP